jgi:RNA polymerase sigma factor for flagellar operon FliA
LPYDTEKYYGLVKYHAQKIYASLGAAGKRTESSELSDLMQEGFRSLLEAAERYQPQRGITFATFASYRIRGAMLDFLRSQERPLTPRERQQIRTFVAVEEALTTSLARRPSRHELARALKVTDEEIGRLEALRRLRVLPLEELTQSDKATGEYLPLEIVSSLPSPEEEVTSARLLEDIHTCLNNNLDSTERNVLILRMLDEMPLRSISQLLSISSIQAKRLEISAKRKLRRFLEDRGWEITDM